MRMTQEEYDQYQARRTAPVPPKRKRKPAPPTASEHSEQVALIERCKRMEHQYPELRMLIAVPNAAKRTKYAGGQIKAEGLAVGFPDLVLFSVSKIPTRHYAEQYRGLVIELKTKVGRVRDAQREWLSRLNECGYYACVARGQDEAFRVLLWYLGYLDSV
jgi:hypothetical protein